MAGVHEDWMERLSRTAGCSIARSSSCPTDEELEARRRDHQGLTVTGAVRP